jgi:hypothetical protein
LNIPFAWDCIPHPSNLSFSYIPLNDFPSCLFSIPKPVFNPLLSFLPKKLDGFGD